MRSHPFFFLTGMTFAIQVKYLISHMNSASMSLFTSCSISGISWGWKCSWGCFLGETPFLMANMWTTTLGPNQAFPYNSMQIHPYIQRVNWSTAFFLRREHGTHIDGTWIFFCSKVKLWPWARHGMVTPIILSFFHHDVLYEWQLLFVSSQNFHRLGRFLAKVNSWCHNLATLSFYHFLGVNEPIRSCFNDIPQM